MKYNSYFVLYIVIICAVSSVDVDSNEQILPFSSIKVINDHDIYITLDKNRQNWQKLLSIDNIGTDAIIKFAKDNYGINNCDYQIECYKYNIIVNFEKIYEKMQSKKLPLKSSLESEFENQVQNGIDVKSSKEKYNLNKMHIEDNIRLSKLKFKIFSNLITENKIFKSLRGSLSNIFTNDNNSKIHNLFR